MSHSFGLDAVRAAAIAGVLFAHAIQIALSHASPPFWTQWPGVVGVEIFFVLSGFLIGGLLLDIADAERETPGQWSIFMVRRWMRTLPLYVVCVLALLVLEPPDNPAQRAVEFLTLTQNLAHPLRDTWFAVTWSLTVEEWFYLLFSVAFLGGSAIAGKAGRIAAVGAFLVVPLALRLLVPAYVPWGDIRTIVVFRLDAIAYGVVLVMLLRSGVSFSLRSAVALFGLGIALNALAYRLPSGGVLERALAFNAISLGVMLCFPLAMRLPAGGGLARAAVGEIAQKSYALYLLHLLIWALINRYSPFFHYHSVVAVPLTMSATWLLSRVSWAVVERPVLRLRPRQLRTPAIA